MNQPSLDAFHRCAEVPMRRRKRVTHGLLSIARDQQGVNFLGVGRDLESKSLLLIPYRSPPYARWRPG